MKWLLAILVLLTILVSGCTQSTITGRYSYARYGNVSEENPDFQILGSSWAFEDNCQYGNKSIGYVFLNCKSNGMYCEVYVNDKKSDYGLEGLQPCDYDITVADIGVSEKPDFISAQSADKWYYTRRDRNKFIEICCSYIDPTTRKLNRDYEVCQTTRLDAQCPEQVARGFGQMTMQSWELYYDGTLEFKVRNEVGQDIIIRKIYINDKSSTLYTAYVPLRNISQTLTVTGVPTGRIGNSYAMSLAIEYITVSNPDVYLNSTGTLTGTYS